jgi:arylsulfatase A-like enzyme
MMNQKKFQFSILIRLFTVAFVASLITSCGNEKKADKPNVLIIYVDDLGYGDVSCYGAKAVHTPNVDSLAANGLLFTDAHCSASTCTPSRYALLTGSYAFRRNAAILPGDAPLLIDTAGNTIADMFKSAGYATAAIGKWHLGLGNGSPDWNTAVRPGPLEIGFDYSFLIPATPDRVPTVYVENHHVLNLDTTDPIEVSYKHRVGDDPIGLEHPEMLKMQADSQHSGTIINGISRIGFMKGGHTAYWKDEDFATVLNQKAKEFITAHKDQPFFLYYALPSIHVPRAPNAKFVGATTMGPRGDDIVQMDWMTGEVMKTLKELGIEKNTLVIFSSDNGPVLDDGYADEAVTKLGDHKPAGIYSGGKYSAFEGGTRVPTILYWPGHIQQGESDALISQVDFYRSLASLIGVKPQNATDAPDSRDLHKTLLGQSKTGRHEMVEEAFTMCIRQDEWKYIEPVSQKTPDWLKNKAIPTGLQSEPQLYNLKDDPAESHNLADQYPDKLRELSSRLKEIMKSNTITQ